MKEVPDVKHTLELTGSGLTKPVTFTYEQLAAMEMTKLDKLLMLKTHEDDETTCWRGVPLDKLLATAGIKSGPMRVTLEATDGYSKQATLEELKSAIVALQDGDGGWLSQSGNKCPLRLVTPEMPGDYWIMYLSKVTVEPTPGANTQP